MKKVVFIMAILLAFAGCGEKPAQETAGVEVRIAALKGPTAMGMVKLMDDAEEKVYEDKYEFSISLIDEIVANIAKNEVDIAAVPANLSPVLYKNTGGKIKVLAINTLGVLNILTKGEDISSIYDLKGKTLYATGKGTVPEYVLSYILKSNGLEIGKDVMVEFKSEPAEVVAILAGSEKAVAMLPQPFVVSALSKVDGLEIALDLTTEWDNVSGGESTMITGVIIAGTEFIEKNPEAVSRFMENYESSAKFANENVDTAASLVAKYDIVDENIAKKAIPFCNITFIDGEEMKTKLEGYLAVLLAHEPESVGGNLPDENFYY